jgi:hypothetical protein
MQRYIVVQSCKTDQKWDWYLIDTVKRACVDRLCCGYAQATDHADRLNREAN